MKVAARGLSLRYGARTALEAFDLDVAAGEIVGLLGPNGAGKSSALRLLATGRPPSSGTLSLFGMDPRRELRTIRRRTGVAGDDAIHLDALTGFENALGFAMAAGLARGEAERRLTPLLERFGLGSDGHRPVSQYSLGMRRKLLLVEALAHEPGLLILDEPTASLDHAAQALLSSVLLERAEAGAAVVMATHDVHHAEHLCDRVVFLREGRTVLQGQPLDLIARLGGSTRFEFTLAATTAPQVRVAGAEVTLATTSRLVARATDGGSPLPALCDAIQRAGAAIEAVVVRRPDLSDVFLGATGQDLAS